MHGLAIMKKRTKSEVSLSELRTFVAAFETGTFTAAARRLGVTQPAVSRQLIKLQSRLGLMLLKRDGHHIELTVNGERFFQYARNALAGFDEMMSEIKAENAVPKGELRIGASTTLYDYLVLDWVREFGLLNRDVVPFVYISDSDDVEEDIVDGDSDLGFIGRLPIHASLHYEPVADDEVVLAVPSNHRFALRDEIDLEELEGQPFISRDRATASVGTVASTLRELGLEMPARRFVMTRDSAQACLDAVAHGFGMTWISSLPFIQGEVAKAVPVRIRGIRFKRKLYLIHRNRSINPAGWAFKEWLLSEICHARAMGSSPPSAQIAEKTRPKVGAFSL